MYKQRLNSLGVDIPSILLPKNEYMQKWPVIACDQFTQDRDYWSRAKTFTSDAPSTLNMIFPEVFLMDDDASLRIKDIHSTMKKYLNEGVFAPPLLGFMYIERDTPYQKKRRGLVAAIDLEHYDWHSDARPLIRCTEGTVPERLPPRMDIRRGAPLELPHVLLLIDDDKDSLLPALGEIAVKNSPVYKTPLMMDSGSITGWLFNSDNDMSFIADKLEELCKRSGSRYGVHPDFLFAVGDGNHSLAAAKGIWEEYKKNNKDLFHPCRYALVEIENIYDPAIQFEPIHRLIFDIGYDKTVSLFSKLPGYMSCYRVSNLNGLSELVKKPAQGNRYGVISQGCYALIETTAQGISTASLQPLLDEYAGDNPHLIDYIHDEAELFRLSGEDPSNSGGRTTAGILLPPVQKSGLFDTVARLGPLPRKSFSMGHSIEKRFYLEARSINNKISN